MLLCKSRKRNTLILEALDYKLNIIAILQATYIDDIMYLNSLYTVKKYRRKGVASLLLKYMFHERRKNKCRKIELTDCSDMFQDKQNIYLKHGFHYENIGQPEMVIIF